MKKVVDQLVSKWLKEVEARADQSGFINMVEKVIEQ